MYKMDLQQTAEDLIDLEARIINWRGNPTGWMKELSRVSEEIDRLNRQAECEKNPIQEAFLKCLQHKTTQCRKQVLNRVDRMKLPKENGFPGNHENPATEPAVSELQLQNDALCVVK